MRVLIICLTLVLYCMFADSQVLAFKDNESLISYKTIAESPWAQILVEKKLYRKSDNKPFFAHVCIKNKSDITIAFDLSKHSLFYINQWCPNNEPQRYLIDETRLNMPITTKQDTQYLIDIFNKKRSKDTRSVTLVKLKPGKFFDYYIAFNNGNYADIERSNRDYIIIVMDGHIVFTDGKNLQIIERDASDDVRAEVPITVTPNFWGKIPVAAKTFVY